MSARSRSVRCWLIVSATVVTLAGVSTPLAADDGSIVAWGGRNLFGETDVPEPNSGFVAIACGFAHSLGLTADGSIVAWGAGGPRGINPPHHRQSVVPTPNSGFVAVAAGSLHSLGLKEDGSIVAWGYNDYGQRDVPAPNSGFVAVAGAYRHSLGSQGRWLDRRLGTEQLRADRLPGTEQRVRRHRGRVGVQSGP